MPFDIDRNFVQKHITHSPGDIRDVCALLRNLLVRLSHLFINFCSLISHLLETHFGIKQVCRILPVYSYVYTCTALSTPDISAWDFLIHHLAKFKT